MTKEKKALPKSNTVELVKSAYQPRKDEIEEEFSIKIPGSTLTEKMATIGRTLTQPVNVRWIKKPRRRRAW